MEQYSFYDGKSISNRMRKLQLYCKLKMQYCAILSQIHRHKDALDQAKEGVKLSHQLVNDLKSLCEFYTKREEIENSFISVKNIYNDDLPAQKKDNEAFNTYGNGGS